MPVLCGNRHAHATPTYHTDSDTVRLCFASPTSVGAPPRRGWLREAQEARGGACYRCSGKGRQTDCGHAQHRLRATALVDTPDTADWSGCCDRVRNDLYDRFGIRWNI